MLRLFELVGECSYAMESDTVPGVRSAMGNSRAARVIIPRLEHAVKAFVRSAHWVRFVSVFRQEPDRKHGSLLPRLGGELYAMGGSFSWLLPWCRYA